MTAIAFAKNVPQGPIVTTCSHATEVHMQGGSMTERVAAHPIFMGIFRLSMGWIPTFAHTGMREFHAGCVKFTHARIKGGWARDGLHTGRDTVFGDDMAFAMLSNDPKNRVVARPKKPIVRSVG